jgi:hypothetical protein
LTIGSTVAVYVVGLVGDVDSSIDVELLVRSPIIVGDLGSLLLRIPIPGVLIAVEPLSVAPPGVTIVAALSKKI